MGSGGTFSGTVGRPLILHWNGRTWRQATIPVPGTGELLGVSASSASNAWAVGRSETASGERTLVLHWNGRNWARQASPSPGGGNAEDSLAAVGASSAGNAWAVGTFTNGGIDKTLTLHWNGHRWARVPSPDRGDAGSGNSLAGVAVTSGSDALAVGSYLNDSDTAQNVLLLHWNGRAWKSMPGPAPAPRNALTAVAASSGSSATASSRPSSTTCSPAPACGSSRRQYSRPRRIPLPSGMWERYGASAWITC